MHSTIAASCYPTMCLVRLGVSPRRLAPSTDPRPTVQVGWLYSAPYWASRVTGKKLYLEANSGDIDLDPDGLGQIDVPETFVAHHGGSGIRPFGDEIRQNGGTPMHIPPSFLAILLAGALMIPAARAQDLVDGSDVEGIMRAARAYGSAALATQPDGNPMLSGRINGIPYSARLRNCTARDCADMNFRVGFMIKPTPEAINNWNRDKRFSKAYLDNAGDAILEMDVVLSGGVSPDNLGEVFAYWRLTLDQFSAYIGFR